MREGFLWHAIAGISFGLSPMVTSFLLWISFATACTRSQASRLLLPALDAARANPAAAISSLCGGTTAGLNIFLAKNDRSSTNLSSVEHSVVEAVLFNHPSAHVFILSVGAVDQRSLEPYWTEGYCVVSIELEVQWMQAVIRAAEPSISSDQLNMLFSSWKHFHFFLNSVVLALQILEGGVNLGMDGLLLNPFDMMLPASLSLQQAAVFIEKVLDPDEPAPPETLEREDFEQSWMPRSHSDRGDGRTLLCGDLSCPRSLPKGCPLGKQIFRAWLEKYFVAGTPPVADLDVTRIYRTYIRGRPLEQTQLQDGEFAAVTYPGWVMVEPHFPDNWRYYGHRGVLDEAEDRAQFHSQLFSPRAHRERSDWSLIRSLKLWLPMSYGPPAARNTMPRSTIDLVLRFVALHITSVDRGPRLFGTAAKKEIAHDLHTPADQHEALENPMAESLGTGSWPNVTREVVLPGGMGGFRTFRDVRVIGRSECGSRGAVSHVGVVARLNRTDVNLFCRPAARPEVSLGGPPQDEAVWRRCQQSLSPEGFHVRGSPAEVNAALALLAYYPVSGRGHPPNADDDPNARLDLDALADHFTDIDFELQGGSCSSISDPAANPIYALTIKLKALVDDVQDQVTVVAHSASRCELLERLAKSFRTMYERLPIIVTCECSKENSCEQLVVRNHQTIPNFAIVDVPYDYGLSRGKRLLIHRVQTEFILVLDDDFVRSPLSCIECMVLHMRSQLHSLTLPFDLLGFPILEDERNFGAFRGQLRATSGRLILEPMISESASDGCLRVGIHPMAFLARTARLRTFKFQEQLQVGEHEQFFYANRYMGLQAGVCFDSTFPHFRVQMTSGYKQRRERMQEMMTKEFTKIGFPSMVYLLHKNDAYSGPDYHEFVRQNIEPWTISDDTCGPAPTPPMEFAMFFVAIFSTADERGAQYRWLLRGGAPESWLSRLSAAASTNWAFFVEEEAVIPGRIEDEADFGDLVFMPRVESSAAGGRSAAHLHFVLSHLKDFHFSWLLVAEQATFVHIEPVLLQLMRVDPPVNAVVGGWKQATATSQQASWLPSEFFAMSFDMKHLLASPRVFRWLRTDVGDGSAAVALNAWLAPLQIRRDSVPGVHVGWAGAVDGCPGSASTSHSKAMHPLAVLHPVSPGELQRMSKAAVLHGSGCEGFDSSWANLIF